MLSLSVFIFAYNEAESLEAVAKETCDTLEELGCRYEVVIIDDGSSDGSSEIADRLARELTLANISVIHHDRNYGLGSVYKTAFANARCDLVTFTCADGQIPAEIIKQFLPLMNEMDMDMVLGYVPNRRDSLLSKILSKVERVLYRTLFGPMPKFQGVLMFKRKLLDELKLKSDGGRAWTIIMELIIRVSKSGYRVMNVPVKLRLRMNGKSKVNNLITVWANLKQVFMLRHFL